jgi:hypothetical protein
VLNFPKTRKWRVEILCKKWLNMNEDLACRKIIDGVNITQERNLGKYFDKVRCKWGNEVKQM